MDKVRFAIVGLGMMGRQQCTRAVKHPKSELVEVVDTVEEKARKAAEEFACRFSTDAMAVTSRDDVDAVIIVVPHYDHPDMAIAAVENGKHVFCEKPLAVTVSQGDRMVEAVKKSEVVFGVDYQMRASASIQKFREFVQSGSLGEVHRVHMVYTSLRPMSYFRMGEWRGTWAGEGGGVTLNQGTHPLDVFQWVFGLPVELQSWADVYMHDIAVEDYASAMVRFENGAHGHIHLSTCEFPQTFRFEIFAEKGQVVFDGSRLRSGRFDIGVREHIDDEKNWKPSRIDWEEVELGDVGWGNHDGIFDDFVEAVLNKRAPLATAEDALRSLELTNAIILSSARHKAVRFPIDRAEYDELLDEFVRRERAERGDRERR